MRFLLGRLRPLVDKGEVVFHPDAVESSVPERFRLEPAVFSYELKPVMSTRRYTVSKLRFPSPVETADAENNVVHAEYFARSASARNGPAVIVLHILGADFPLSRYMAARLADRGVAALFVKLPYYGERRPPRATASTKRFLSADIERTVTAMRQGVCDVRRAAFGWLLVPRSTRSGSVSRESAWAASFRHWRPRSTRRSEKGVFLLAGGDLSSILWEMPEGAAYRKRWIESGRTRTEI